MSNTDNPNWPYNYVPTSAEWEAAFAAKQDHSTVLDDVIANGGAPTFANNTSWTPTDQSGGTLTFTGASAAFCQIGNMTFAYGQLTFPVTADTHAAKISLPIPVPPQFYAKAPTIIMTSGSVGALAVAQPSSATFVLLNAATYAALTNANLSGLTIDFMIAYPTT